MGNHHHCHVSTNVFRYRPHHAGNISQCSYLGNPNRASSNWRNLKTQALRFSVDRKIFKLELSFRKRRDHDNHLISKFSSNTKWLVNCWILKFLRSTVDGTLKLFPSDILIMSSTIICNVYWLYYHFIVRFGGGFFAIRHVILGVTKGFASEFELQDVSKIGWVGEWVMRGT